MWRITAMLNLDQQRNCKSDTAFIQQFNDQEVYIYILHLSTIFTVAAYLNETVFSFEWIIWVNDSVSHSWRQLFCSWMN